MDLNNRKITNHPPSPCANIKKFHDRTYTNILLLTLVVGMAFFINICVGVMESNLSAYSHVIFYYHTQIYSI